MTRVRMAVTCWHAPRRRSVVCLAPGIRPGRHAVRGGPPPDRARGPTAVGAIRPGGGEVGRRDARGAGGARTDDVALQGTAADRVLGRSGDAG